MIRRWKEFWNRQVTNNERRLRQLGICGTVMICLGAIFLMGAGTARKQRVQDRNAVRLVQNNHEPRLTREEEDALDWLLSREGIFYLTAVVLITHGHGLSRWAAFQQGILSTRESED